MSDPNGPKCPKCGSNRQVYEDGDRGFWCDSCKVAFDNDPDEGGTHSNDPTKRIERTEALAAGQAAWKNWHETQRPNHRRRRGR